MNRFDANSHGTRLLAGIWLFTCLMSFAGLIAHVARQQAAEELAAVVEVTGD